MRIDLTYDDIICDLDFRVYLTSDLDDLDAAYKLRYKAYVEQFKEQQIYADHDKKKIVEPYDLCGEQAICVDADDNIIGTFRCNPWKNLPPHLRTNGIAKYLGDVGLCLPDGIDPNKCSSGAKFCSDLRKTKYNVKGFPHRITFGLAFGYSMVKILLDNGVYLHFGTCHAKLLNYYFMQGYRVLKQDVRGTFDNTNDPNNTSHIIYYIPHDEVHFKNLGLSNPIFTKSSAAQIEKAQWLAETLVAVAKENGDYIDPFESLSALTKKRS